MWLLVGTPGREPGAPEAACNTRLRIPLELPKKSHWRHWLKGQRERRDRMARIDYYPSTEATAIIKATLSTRYPLNSLKDVLDTIRTEWAAMTAEREQSADER